MSVTFFNQKGAECDMRRKWIFLIAVVLMGTFNMSAADEGKDIWERRSLTDGFWGLNDALEDDGIEIGLGVTNIYQQNVRGGISKHRRAGRFSGSYDFELFADMQKLLGIEGANLYIHTEGSWSKSGGIDVPSVGSSFGVNGDGVPRRTMDVTEFWYEQSFFGGSCLLRIGKMDITGGFECHGCPVAFDGSRYANDETRQFLNGALVNNPTIPFPDYALGAAFFYNPSDTWYLGGGAVDAQNDFRETGFNTALHKEDYFFYILEAGMTSEFDSANGPLLGAYRAGVWYDPQPKANSDGDKNYRDDTGFYLSFCQRLTRENAEPQDNQGLGAFFRYGYASSKRNDITNFWSFGFQYQGLIDGRDEDVLGIGFAQGIFSDAADVSYTDDYENAIELYYNAQVTGWLNISPSIQYVANPGGDQSRSDAIVLGLRAQMNF
jgi:porin